MKRIAKPTSPVCLSRWLDERTPHSNRSNSPANPRDGWSSHVRLPVVARVWKRFQELDAVNTRCYTWCIMETAIKAVILLIGLVMFIIFGAAVLGAIVVMLPVLLVLHCLGLVRLNVNVTPR